jgi:hypothetical protein
MAFWAGYVDTQDMTGSKADFTRHPLLAPGKADELEGDIETRNNKADRVTDLTNITRHFSDMSEESQAKLIALLSSENPNKLEVYQLIANVLQTVTNLTLAIINKDTSPGDFRENMGAVSKSVK